MVRLTFIKLIRKKLETLDSTADHSCKGGSKFCLFFSPWRRLKSINYKDPVTLQSDQSVGLGVDFFIGCHIHQTRTRKHSFVKTNLIYFRVFFFLTANNVTINGCSAKDSSEALSCHSHLVFFEISS